MAKVTFEDWILFEDDDFMVINKPSGIATLADRQEDNGQSIIELARAYHPDASPVHRLDKETTGCLAIAKSQEAYRHLAIQFERRDTQKIYHAVVDGLHDFEDVSVYLPIKTTRSGKVSIDKMEGKPAETIFKSIKAFRNHTLVGAMPITGRMHQIRVHLAVLKAPIVMDGLYGGKMLYLSQIKRKFNLKKGTEEEPLIKRVALHAHKLRYTLRNGTWHETIADYPKDFKALVRQLEINS